SRPSGLLLLISRCSQEGDNRPSLFLPLCISFLISSGLYSYLNCVSYILFSSEVFPGAPDAPRSPSGKTAVLCRLSSELACDARICLFHDLCRRIKSLCDLTDKLFCFLEARFQFLIACCVGLACSAFPLTLQRLEQRIHLCDDSVHSISLIAVLVCSLPHLIRGDSDLFCHRFLPPWKYIYISGFPGIYLLFPDAERGLELHALIVPYVVAVSCLDRLLEFSRHCKRHIINLHIRNIIKIHHLILIPDVLKSLMGIVRY